MRKTIWVSWALSLCLFTGSAVVPTLPAAAAADVDLNRLSDESDGALAARLAAYVIDSFRLSEEDSGYVDNRSFWEVELGGLPEGYAREFLGIFYQGGHTLVTLLAADANAERFRTMDTVSEGTDGDLVINTAKLEAWTEDGHLFLWSQAPFRAFQSEAELAWDGAGLRVLLHEYSDPTAAFYEEKASLLQKGDLAGLMRLQRTDGDSVVYPAFYQEHYALAAPVLKLAYKKALEAYKKKDVKTALADLKYGIDQYADPYALWSWEDGKLTAQDLKGDPDGYNPEGRLPEAELIAILNDYGFILSEAGRNKEAKPILLNVIRLAPKRTVAYLNAADAEWALGEKKAAKAHYKQYQKLLGKNAAKAPKRVKERINAK